MFSRVFLFLICLLIGCAAGATDSSLPMIDMRHTAWRASDGAPGRITSMAQTPDGWLWLATSRGLFRFDGVTFEKYQPRNQPLISSNVFAVGTLASGTLWISYRLGGLSFLQNDNVVHYTEKDGLPIASLRTLVEDKDGGIWLGSPVGLYYRRPNETSWRLTKIEGLSEKPRVASIAVDDRGTVWVRTLEATVARTYGEKAFHRVADGGSFGQIVKAPDGSVWMCDLDKPGIQRLSEPLKSSSTHFPDLPSSTHLIFDHDGNAWVAPTNEFGIMRVDRQEKADRMSKIDESQGLTGTPNALLVDIEGNIWVGTGKGIDRFRRNRLTAINTPAYLADANPIAAGPNGSLRVDRYILSHPGEPDQRLDMVGPPQTSKNIVSNVYSDPDGSFWIGASDGLAHIVNGERIDIVLPETLKKGTISGMTKDKSGRLWVARGRTYRIENGEWIEAGDVPGLVGFNTNSLFCDSQGRIWFGAIGNQIAVLDGSQVKIFGEKDGLRLNSIKQIIEHAGEFWVGGEGGLAYFDGKRFSSIVGYGNEVFAGASGIVADAKGGLWINGLDGISNIKKDELLKAKGDPGYRVKFERYDFLDGLNGTPSQFPQTPSAVIGTDGRMWFSTSFGIYNLDPEKIPRNSLPPTVVIRKLRVADTEFAQRPGLSLPAGTTSAQIDYTALSLTMPERMQFRYRLDGVDKDWQDVGTRRTAFYTNLTPGKYRFHVVASNNDGIWNETGATLDFAVQPTFAQTFWFKVLCVVLAAAVLYLVYRWRLAYITKRVRERLQERLLERERIARTLHDTLLQGVQLLTMRFQFAVDRLPSDMPERKLMERALDVADQVVEEARGQVKNLRSNTNMESELQNSLKEAANALGLQQNIEFGVRIIGEPRALQPLVTEEILSIAKEALMNALKHANATRISITLDYNTTCLILSVKDNGRGIDPDILDSGHRVDHWGIPGMQERAAELKTTLIIKSAPDAGTEILLSVPARLAYSAIPHEASWNSLKLWAKTLLAH